MADNVSKYDPSRDTVGAIYKGIQKPGSEDTLTAGDVVNELMKGLVDDLNETIASNPFDGRSFYITIHEKKDLQMPRAFLRRLIKTEYRPYPEDDTTVFRVNPKSGDVRFCWCLPHWSEMDNMLANEWQYDREMISHIKAWKANDLTPFGFGKDSEGKPVVNLNFVDKPLQAKNRGFEILLPAGSVV